MAIIKPTLKKYNGANWDTLYPKTTSDQIIGLENVNNTADSVKNVASAAKLSNARQLNRIAFDGTADKQIPLWNIAVGHNIANTTTPWFKVGSVSSQSINTDFAIVFHIQGTFSTYGRRNGILRVSLRTDSPITNKPIALCMWEHMNDINLADFVIAHSENISPVIAEIWVRCPERYNYYLFDVLSECNRGSNTKPGLVWELYNKPTGNASITEGLTQVTSTYAPKFDASYITTGQINPNRIAIATASTNGLMNSVDKIKLDAMPKITLGTTAPTGVGAGDFWFETK